MNQHQFMSSQVPGAVAGTMIPLEILDLNQQEIGTAYADNEDVPISAALTGIPGFEGVHDENGTAVGVDVYDGNGDQVVDLEMRVGNLPTTGPGEVTRRITMQPRSLGAVRIHVRRAPVGRLEP